MKWLRLTGSSELVPELNIMFLVQAKLSFAFPSCGCVRLETSVEMKVSSEPITFTEVKDKIYK